MADDVGCSKHPKQEVEEERGRFASVQGGTSTTRGLR